MMDVVLTGLVLAVVVIYLWGYALCRAAAQRDSPDRGPWLQGAARRQVRGRLPVRSVAVGAYARPRG